MRLASLLPRLAIAAFALTLSSPSFAGDYVGIDTANDNLYSIDSGVGIATNLGTITGGPAPFFHSIGRSPNGRLYVSVPGFVTGYSIYQIDQNTLQATLVHNVPSNTSGNIGMAVDPSGKSIWIAGFVALSLIVEVQEVNLLTGVMTQHGTTVGSLTGLAFDGNGDLFTCRSSASSPTLLKINQANANTTVIAQMSGVDGSAGLGVASNRNSAEITVFSRNTGSLFSVDTATATATLISNLVGAGAVKDIANDNSCGGSATNYGTGCPGTANFTPILDVSGCPVVGDDITISISKGLGGSNALVLFGLAQGSVPVGGGCTLLVTPLLSSILSVPLGGVGAGSGSVSFGGTLPPSAAGVTFTVQAWVIDSSSPVGAAATNGVQVDVP